MKIEKIKSQKDGLELEIAIFEPSEKPKAIVQISHGMAEHKERYYPFMEFLAKNGFVCVIHDHRGHGESVKKKEDYGYFYTENIDYIVDDLHQVTLFAKEEFQSLPVFLFSHSMGTLVSRNYLKKFDGEIEKLVLCGPPTENKLTKFAIFLAKLSKFFGKDNKPNKFLNKLTFGSYNRNLMIENEWICSNVETVEKYNDDEKCGFVFTTNGFINLFKLMEGAFNKKGWEVQNPNLKIFVIAGENDPVIQNKKKFESLVKFLEERGYGNVSSKLYPSMRHEILNEKNNQIVYNDVLEFLCK